MSAQEQEEEQEQSLFQVRPDFDEWWANQVRAALPRWRHGTWRYGFQDAHVQWPYPPERLAARLEHLANLKAHA